MPRLVGSTTVLPPSSTNSISSSIAASTSTSWQLSRLRNGFMRRSPSMLTSIGRSASPISEPQHGRFHQLDASRRMCSCISVTPSCPGSTGPVTLSRPPPVPRGVRRAAQPAASIPAAPAIHARRETTLPGTAKGSHPVRDARIRPRKSPAERRRRPRQPRPACLPGRGGDQSFFSPVPAPFTALAVAICHALAPPLARAVS